MNPVERAHLRCRIDTALARPWFFLCGAPKSGTTWLQRVLDAHPEIACAGEGHFADRLQEGLVNAFRYYNEQQETVARLVYEGEPFYQGLNQRLLDYTLESLMALVATQRPIGPEVRWIGDKTPRYTFYLDALWRLMPEARVIHIIRDGRDVVVSSLHHAKRSGVADALDRDGPGFLKNVGDYARIWADNVAAARRHAADRPDRYLEVRYEDLHADPMGLLGQVAGFLGVADGEEVWRPCLEAADFRRLAKRKQGEENAGSFYRKGVAGDWRNFFDEAALAAVQAGAGETLAELGYVD